MGAECHHPDGVHPGLKGSALSHALGAAESRCVATQERLTTPRRRVLELLLESNAPQKAYDLIAAFGAHGEPAKPPTVYRALEFLERLGFAHRIESLNAYVPCRIDGQSHRAAFLICDCCGAAEEFEPDFTAQLAAAAKAGYQISTITLEARGRCSACGAD
ncbi:MAG: Fur family transcriptional regulator [Pseudomonadota bacterium]|uniref:Fur family transcriptional regulator n=1 Tax=unclassified Phenylobacterium TaxID=2640670 RepID=UPI0006F63BB5|nr:MULTISPECIES: Fur family transcriptional regulator [unclassified Phenylobacterium]KRB46734.1 Fur family transcriptional regulator [Phenylobacterium sp. Root700]MBT9470325.1 transcriptional repressor [Phenylobacterium sp.]